MPEAVQSAPLRFAVIGGGITGLAAAHRLIELSREAGRPAEIVQFEGSDRVGGVAGTIRVGDYLVETGADSFITNKPACVRLTERLGITDRLIKTEEAYRGSLVLRKGRPLPVPEGFMLLSPAKTWPILTSSIFSPWGKARMGLEFFIPKRTVSESDDESLADFVRRRFGREALDRLVQPLVGGIYTSDPERLSLKATLPRFIEQEQRFGSLIRASRHEVSSKSRQAPNPNGGGARYSLFATFKDGMSGLFNTLAARVEASGQLRKQTKIDRIQHLSNGRVELFSETRSCDEFDGVILAVPAFRAAALLESTSSPNSAAISTALKEIEYASTAIVLSGHKLSDIEHPLDSFGLVIPAIERRRVLAVSFSSRKFAGRAPEGRVILRTFVGGAMQPEQLEHPDERIEAIVRDELRSMLGVKGTPDFMIVARHNHSMPQYYVGHLERVRRINELLQGIPGIELAGNAYSGVGLPDCIDSAEQAAARLFQFAQANSQPQPH